MRRVVHEQNIDPQHGGISVPAAVAAAPIVPQCEVEGRVAVLIAGHIELKRPVARHPHRPVHKQTRRTTRLHKREGQLLAVLVVVRRPPRDIYGHAVHRVLSGRCRLVHNHHRIGQVEVGRVVHEQNINPEHVSISVPAAVAAAPVVLHNNFQ